MANARGVLDGTRAPIRTGTKTVDFLGRFLAEMLEKWIDSRLRLDHRRNSHLQRRLMGLEIDDRAHRAADSDSAQT
jgi:hypothetical protein